MSDRRAAGGVTNSERILDVCRSCKSTNLSYEGTVVWNPKKGCYDLLECPPFSRAEYCKDCGSDKIDRLVGDEILH